MDLYSLPVPGSGGKTCSQIFEEAGCDTPASPNCGACIGGPRDTYARMNELMASSLHTFFLSFYMQSLNLLSLTYVFSIINFNLQHHNPSANFSRRPIIETASEHLKKNNF